MKQFSYTIQDPLGIHARVAGLLVKQAKTYASKITLHKGDKSVELTKLIMLMGMGVRQGEEVVLTVEGADEEIAAAAFERFFQQNL